MSRNFQQGFSLIEVVVTMFIMSVGLLGLAGLQSTSVKDGLEVAKTSQTTWMVSDLVERIRSNIEALDGDYTGIDADILSCDSKPAKQCANNPERSAEACTDAEMAEYDIWEVFCGWSHSSDSDIIANTQDKLNLTEVDISCEPAPCTEQSDYTVSITWDADNVANNVTLIKAGKADAQKTRTISIEFRP